MNKRHGFNESTLTLAMGRFKLLFKLFTLFSFIQGFACTDFLLKDEKDHVVVGRSMEFGTPLHSKITFFPKGEKSTSLLKDQKKGLSWKSRYAYLAITPFDLDIVVDGMNEKGLSIGLLWFPGAKYPKVSLKDPKKTIALEDLGNWILASFSSLEEVKQALKKVHIWADVISELKQVPPLHLSLHDRKGNTLTVEFLNGKMEILDNPVGVLTNAPKLEWHITNLRNYINLKAVNQKKEKLDGSTLEATGQGSGLLGIPGDWTPPSRFVKIAILKHFAIPAKSSAQNINLAFHLLNTVDIPYGVIRSARRKSYDYTQWIVVKDLENQKLYYRTYENMDLHCLDLKKIKGKNRKNIPMKNVD